MKMLKEIIPLAIVAGLVYLLASYMFECMAAADQMLKTF